MSAVDRSLVNPIYGNKTSADTIPANVTKTGTIASTGTRVAGTGTAFKTLTQLRKGDYIYAQNQIRRIEAIFSDTILSINAAFAPDLAALTALKVVRNLPNISVGISNAGGATAKISTMTSDSQDLLSKQSVFFNSNNGVGPIAYNPNGATLVVSNGLVTTPI